MAASTKKNKVEVKKKWTERETVSFVELYEAEEVLWNVRLNDYKNKDARNAAIERIIHNLNIPGGLTFQDVNTKINNIRSTYSQEKAKISKSTGTGSGLDDIYVPTLVWFEIADRFLSSVVKSRKTFQNVVDSNESLPDIPASPSPDIPAHSSPDIPANPSPDILANPSPDILANPSPDIPANPSPDIPNTERSTSTSNNAQFVVPSSRKRIRKALPEHITKSIEALQSIKDQAVNSREIEDEFYHFGKNVASQLRQLPLLYALDVQSDILNLIKIKRQSIIRSTEETSSSSESQHYTIEIPEHMFVLQQEETIALETNDVLQNEVQDIQHTYSILQQETRSIGGFTQTPEDTDLLKELNACFVVSSYLDFY